MPRDMIGDSCRYSDGHINRWCAISNSKDLLRHKGRVPNVFVGSSHVQVGVGVGGGGGVMAAKLGPRPPILGSFHRLTCGALKWRCINALSPSPTPS